MFESRDPLFSLRSTINSKLPRSLRQLRAGLFSDHVLGVPIWPVRVSLAGAFLMFAVSCLRPPKRARQIARRTEHRCCGIDPARKTRRDFLEQPAVPVWIFERGKRVVRTALRVAPGAAWMLQSVVEGAAGEVNA